MAESINKLTGTMPVIPTGDYTVLLFAKTSSSPDLQILELDGGLTLEVNFGTLRVNGFGYLNDFTEWSGIGFAYDSSEEEADVYINGERVGTLAGDASLSSGAFTVGLDAGSNVYAVRVVDSKLSDDTIEYWNKDIIENKGKNVEPLF